MSISKKGTASKVRDKCSNIVIAADCIGIILLYVKDPSIMTKFLLLSHHINRYIEENYHCCRNIRFVAKRSPPKKSIFPFVMKLYVGEKIKKIVKNYTQLFPNLRCLHLEKRSKTKNSIFNYTPNLEKLVLDSCPTLNDLPFEKLPNLRHLEVDHSQIRWEKNYSSFNTSKFVHLKKLENLSLKSVLPLNSFDPNHFSQLTKLTSLSMDRSRLFTSEIFKYLPSLENLSVVFQKFDLIGFEKYLKNNSKPLRVLTIRNCAGIYCNRDKVIEALGGKEPELFTFRAARRKMGEIEWVFTEKEKSKVRLD